jgi:hypothetical protein
MAANQNRFLRRGEFPPGIGPAVLHALVAKGLVAIGPATTYPRETGYRISQEGLAQVRGKELARERMAQSNGGPDASRARF